VLQWREKFPARRLLIYQHDRTGAEQVRPKSFPFAEHKIFGRWTGSSKVLAGRLKNLIVSTIDV